LALAPAPLPPRRPRDAFMPEAPLPVPMAPVVASMPSPLAEPVLGHDVKGAVRALFDPRTIVASTGFSPQLTQDLSIAHFSGPAVKPLPVFHEAKADPAQKDARLPVRTSVSAAW
jgi:hypothetical protein